MLQPQFAVVVDAEVLKHIAPVLGRGWELDGTWWRAHSDWLDFQHEFECEAESRRVCQRDELVEVLVVGGESFDGMGEWERGLLFAVGGGRRGNEGDCKSVASEWIITLEEVTCDVGGLLHESDNLCPIDLRQPQTGNCLTDEQKERL